MRKGEATIQETGEQSLNTYVLRTSNGDLSVPFKSEEAMWKFIHLTNSLEGVKCSYLFNKPDESGVVYIDLEVDVG